VEITIAQRKSRRSYTTEAINLEELSFLLWATQGLRGKESAVRNYRTVPSAGCRHALETYIAAFRVEGIPKAVYRYLPMSHQLVEVAKKNDTNKIILHSFAHLSLSKADPEVTKLIFNNAEKRLENTGYKTWQTP
ncbi:unnamed protein product, partial [marine sediment metagenome]